MQEKASAIIYSIWYDEEVDEDDPIELDAKQVYPRKVGQELIIEEVGEDDPIELDAKQGILGE